MKEELITKSLEAFLTGAKVIGEEGRTLISEVINYLLFSAVLDSVKTLAWAFLGYALFRIGKSAVNTVRMCVNNDIEKINKEYECYIDEVKAGKGGPTMSVKDWEKRRDRKIETAKEPISTANGWLYAISLAVGLYWSICALETVRPIGKILTAPRLVLLQEGAHILNTLKQQGTK